MSLKYLLIINDSGKESLQSTSNQVGQRGVQVSSDGFTGRSVGSRRSRRGGGCKVCSSGAAPGALGCYGRHQQVA